ncbi:MAG: recombination mediator RecR [Lentisphaeria bacterium]
MNKSSYPQAIEVVIEQFSRLPGIGRRTAERLTLAVLKWPEDVAQEFAGQISRLKANIHACSNCGNFAEDDLCVICRDLNRNPKQICIVEDATQIPVIEKAGCFEGVYHVLGGRLVPLEGVGPEDLNIYSLHKRIREENVEELIIATSSNVEGEATAAYLVEEFNTPAIKITRIASGIPVGADLSYADSATVAIALNRRSKLL